MNAEAMETVDHEAEAEVAEVATAPATGQREDGAVRPDDGGANVGPPVERAEHPAGEGFFSGEPGELSDSEAEEVARQQLLRSGLLRGQRVRVAE